MSDEGMRYLREKANCRACPLREHLIREGEWKPVPSDIAATDTALVYGFPDKAATDIMRPAVGPFAADVIVELNKHGIERRDVSHIHVVACRYPNDNPDEFLGRLKARNKRLKRQGEQEIPTPAQCCAPRFEAELRLHTNVIAFGDAALKAVGVERSEQASNPKMSDYGGFPTHSRFGQKLLVAPGPKRKSSTIEKKWLPILRADIAKAVRHFRDELTWRDPRMVYAPRPAQVRAFLDALKASGKPLTLDVETAPYTTVDDLDDDGQPTGKTRELFDPVRDRLRCIGIGTDKVVLVIPLEPVNGKGTAYVDESGAVIARDYTWEEWQEIKNLLADAFVDRAISKIGHNAGYYDRMVIETHFGVTPFPLLDTIIAHKLGDSEYYHRLSFVARTYTDVPPWKAEHTATSAKSDSKLWFYNGRDIGVTATIAPMVKKRAIERNQWDLYKRYVPLQDCAVGMHKLGLQVDPERVAQHRERLHAESNKHLKEVLKIAGQDFNPRSVPQLKDLFFEKWELPVQGYTATGEPSTDDSSMRAWLGNPLLDSEQKHLIASLRKYKGADKLLNTYIDNWRAGGKFVDVDGWLYADFNTHGTVGWRYSSSDPNLQNIPYELRDCFIAGYDPETGEPYVFVQADKDQLELRLAAGLAGAPYYVNAFETGEIDVHNLSGQMMLGMSYYDVEGAPKDHREKGEGAFKDRRDLVKRLVYGSLYGARAPTLHDIITEIEAAKDGVRPDGTKYSKGDLMYAALTVQEVRRMHRRWLKAAPEFEVWWRSTVEEYRRQGYLEEPVWGLRRYFANGEEFNEIVNYKVQAGGGAIVHMSMIDLVCRKGAPIPFDFKRRTGLCAQMHDSLTFRVPLSRAKELRDIVQATMTRRVEGIPVGFTAEAKITTRLAETKEDAKQTAALLVAV